MLLPIQNQKFVLKIFFLNINFGFFLCREIISQDDSGIDQMSIMSVDSQGDSWTFFVCFVSLVVIWFEREKKNDFVIC